MGYCPNCIAREGFVWLEKVYCKAEMVLQEMGEKVVEIVLQYNLPIVTEAVRL